MEIKKIPRKTTATRSRVESARENHPDKWGKRKSIFFWFGLLTHRFHPMQNFREKIKDISFKGLKRCNFCLQLRLQKIVATGTSKSSSCRYLTGCYDNQVTNWRMGRESQIDLFLIYIFQRINAVLIEVNELRKGFKWPYQKVMHQDLNFKHYEMSKWFW